MSQKLKVLTGHILQQAKRLFGIPDFKFYAIGDGLSYIFRSSPGKITVAKPSGMDIMQLDLGFT